MTQEEKSLLLKDLCARLPYGVKCKDQYGDYINVNIYNAHIEHLVDQILSGVVQMALRPMSSMTDEEKEEIKSLFSKFTDEFGKKVLVVRQNKMALYQDWLNKHHFDYRGLIEKGLALEVPNGMYNTNNE